MEIASGFTAQNWKELELSTSKPYTDWARAIKVLKNRIIERYIEPIDLLILNEKDKHYSEKRFGFTIIAIDCLLIETLQSFKHGTKETITGEGGNVFIEFLTNSKYLGQYFSDEQAKRFYKEYRNGILHQAETKNGAVIWSVGEVVSEDDTKMMINRTEFHDLIKKDFDYYLKQLVSTDNQLLRKNFIKKMNYISNP